MGRVASTVAGANSKPAAWFASGHSWISSTGRFLMGRDRLVEEIARILVRTQNVKYFDVPNATRQRSKLRAVAERVKTKKGTYKELSDERVTVARALAVA